MKKIHLALGSVMINICSFAQIEIAHLSAKNFSGTGFGAFLNFSVPVSEAAYGTVEGGLGYFSHNDQHIVLAPVLLGYRYTLNGSGTGFYIEPTAGYTFGSSDIYKYNQYDSPIYDANGHQVAVKVTGPTTGAAAGYLFEPSGIIQFNISLRYEHVFSEYGLNMFSLRISHAFNFGRRE